MKVHKSEDPPFPEYLRPYIPEGKKLFLAQAVLEIEFSGGTYQVQVEDRSYEPDAYPWAFLQLDSRGIAKDCFCSCESIGMRWDVSISLQLTLGSLIVTKTSTYPL